MFLKKKSFRKYILFVNRVSSENTKHSIYLISKAKVPPAIIALLEAEAKTNSHQTVKDARHLFYTFKLIKKHSPLLERNVASRKRLTSN